MVGSFASGRSESVMPGTLTSFEKFPPDQFIYANIGTKKYLTF